MTDRQTIPYDPVKTRLSESEAEAEETTNHKAWKRTLWLYTCIVLSVLIQFEGHKFISFKLFSVYPL